MQRLIRCCQAGSIHFAHTRQMFLEQTAAKEFGERSLSELIGVQVSDLFDDAKPLNCRRWSDNPTDA